MLKTGQQRSQLDLDTTLGTRSTLREGGKQVGDVVPWVTVQTSAQSLLVQVVGNETNATAQHEQTVQDTHLQVVLGLLGGESARVAEQVNEADRDTAVDVEDEVVLLGRGHRLDGYGIVEQLVGGEVLGHVFLDELDTQIRVVTRLDLVTDTGNCPPLV